MRPGPLKTLWWATCGRGTVVGPHFSRQLSFKCNKAYYNNAAGDKHINFRQKMLNFECINSNFYENYLKNLQMFS